MKSLIERAVRERAVVERVLRGFAVAILLTMADMGFAQNAIEGFNVTQQGGQILVQITTKAPLRETPANFTVANPARIAFDFPATVNALGKNSQDVGQGELRSMNVVQVGDRTRVVLNLRNMVQHDARIEGRNLIIALSQIPGGAAAASGGARFAEGRNDAKHSIKDIVFRRGKDGEGRIIVDLSDTSTGIDIRQQGQSLVIEFLKSNLPDSLRKRLDVVDFATPVQTVSTFAQGENVRMVIEPRGVWEHNAYQTDTQFVVEVKAVQVDPNKLVQGSRTGYIGEKLSLNFQNIEVRSVLNVIADFTDLNIITSDTVAGNLTLRLKDVPWDQALDIILQTRGLDQRKNGNVVWIAPRDELATKEKLALESRQQITELEPVRTESFQLNYAKADVISKILSDDKQRILSKRGSSVVDPRTNQLFVQDVSVRLEDVRRLISKLDIPVRQVLIEARIVEANDNFSKNLGTRLGFGRDLRSTQGIREGTRLLGDQSLQFNAGGLLAPASQLAGFTAGTPNFTGNSVADTLQNVNLPASGLAGFGAGAFSLILFNQAKSRFLSLELTALESDGKGKIISSPRVLTADNVEALIEQGTELPYQQATSSGATSVSFRKANLALKVKPQITPDGNIIMALDVNKDAVGQVTTSGFAIDTKHIKTEVLVENGGTVVIGGIYTQDTRNTTIKVPLFGDIPVLGQLFRNNQRSDSKTELLVFITPRIASDRLGQR
jgi:type IV pilus assembly protein PilQ